MTLSMLPLAMSAQSGGSGNPLTGLVVPMVLMMAIFWLLILRPQQKRQKEHQNMLASLSKGDRILTNGGIYMTIQDVKDEFYVCVLADGVKVELARNAVAAKVTAKKK